MMVVIADTSPICYLTLIGYIDLLPRLFDVVVIPSAVNQELKHPLSPEPVRNWIMNPPAWISIRSPSYIPHLFLDQGETEAIAIALEIQGSTVLIDEQAGRLTAQRLGLKLTGTLGILEIASARNFIKLPEAIMTLRQTTYFASDELIEAALNRDAARRKKRL